MSTDPNPLANFPRLPETFVASQSEIAQPLLPGVPPSLVHPNPFTGGPAPDREARLDLRRALLAMDGVFAVHDIEPHGEKHGFYFYLIETTFIFPRFTLGLANIEDMTATILFQSGALWSAQDAWLTRESL
jgi:hypothetical protein